MVIGTKPRILVVDDEEDILELVRFNLAREGWSVVVSSSGEEALERIESFRPAIVLLDLMLPGMSGLDVCKHIKSSSAFSNTAVVILSAKGDEADIVTGLELGADDYITKPFSPRVLLARVRAVERRRNARVSYVDERIVQRGIEIDPRRYEVTVDGKRIDLTRTEFQILHLLARQPGVVLTRSQIVDAIRGDDYHVTERSVDVQIVGIRKKLGNRGDLVCTVRGVGYRLADDDDAHEDLPESF